MADTVYGQPVYGPQMGNLGNAVGGFTSGMLQGMQLKMERDRLERQIKESEWNEGYKGLEVFSKMSDQYGDNPGIMENVVAPGMKQALGKMGVNVDPSFQYTFHKTDKKHFKEIYDLANYSYNSGDVGVFNKVMPSIFQRMGAARTPADEKAVRDAVDYQKEQAASMFAADYRMYGAMAQDPNTDPAIKQQLEEYKKNVAIPRIEELDPKLAEKIREGKATELHETGIMGSDLPPDLTKGKNINPAEMYRVMRDSEGNIKKVIGKDKPTFGMLTPRTMYDLNSHTEITMTGEEFAQRIAAEPKRWIDASVWKAYSGKASLIYDIRGSLDRTVDSLKGADLNFSQDQRAKLRQASNALEPETALMNLINGEFGKSLTPAQMNYLARVNQLAEQSMSMRSTLGAGQGSDDLRKAIRRTIPSETTFSKEYAKIQIQEFHRVLDRLQTAIPKNIMNAIEDQKTPEHGERKPAPVDLKSLSPQTKSRLAAFRKANPGASDEELVKAIQAKYGDK